MFALAEILPLAAQIKKLYVKACRAVCKKYELTQTEFDILDFLGVIPDLTPQRRYPDTDR